MKKAQSRLSGRKKYLQQKPRRECKAIRPNTALQHLKLSAGEKEKEEPKVGKEPMGLVKRTKKGMPKTRRRLQWKPYGYWILTWLLSGYSAFMKAFCICFVKLL